jgi:hypothetical protein
MVVIYRVLPQTSSSNLRRAYSDKLESQVKPRRYRIYAVKLVSISLDLQQEQNTSSTNDTEESNKRHADKTNVAFMTSRRFATGTNAPESLPVATASLRMHCVSLSSLLLYVDRRTRYIQDPAHLSPCPYAPWLCNPLYPKHSPNQNICYHSSVDLLLDAATTPYIGIN